MYCECTKITVLLFRESQTIIKNILYFSALQTFPKSSQKKNILRVCSVKTGTVMFAVTESENICAVEF